MKRRLIVILLLVLSFSIYAKTYKNYGLYNRKTDGACFEYTYSLDSNGNIWVVPINVILKQYDYLGKTYEVKANWPIYKVEEMEFVLAYRYNGKWYVGWASYLLQSGSVKKMTAIEVPRKSGLSDKEWEADAIEMACGFYYIQAYSVYISKLVRSGELPRYDGKNIGDVSYFDTSYNVNCKDKAMTVRAPYRLDSLYREDSVGLDYFSVDLYDSSVFEDIRSRGYYICTDWTCAETYVNTYKIELYGSHRRERTGYTGTQVYKINAFISRGQGLRSIGIPKTEKLTPLDK